jgi:glycosyltransferase involved in cell wall biosynthesis
VRLVLLSWRYIGHPQGGGAEILVHEVLRRCVARGLDVTAFTASHPGAAEAEQLDGVKIVRRGAQHTVHLRAWRWLRSRLGDFDRVVEQMNTLPFLTPLYVPRDRRRLLIFQLAREYWFRETRGAFKLGAPLGYALEPCYLRLYRRTPTITISESSRADLAALGVPVTSILPMAVSTPAVEAIAPRNGALRLVIVGRLTLAKFVEEAVQAFAAVQAEVPDAALDVVGSGDAAYRRRLEAVVARRGLRHVTFHGRVDEERKRALLERAHVHVFSSHREGWGLTVTEAARVGTPTVGYDAPGVRDAIADRRLLAQPRTPDALAERVLALHGNPELYESVRSLMWERARRLAWDRTADAFAEAVS